MTFQMIEYLSLTFRLIKRERTCNKASRKMTIFAFFIISIGLVKLCVDIGKIILVHFIKIQNKTEDSKEVLDFPDGPLFLAATLDLCISISIIVAGVIIKIATYYPTQTKAKLLSKRVLIIIIVCFCLLSLVYFLVVYALEDGLSDFLEKKHLRMKADRQRHHERQKYQLSDPVDISNGRYYSSNSIREDFIAMLFLCITTTFAVLCCCLTLYSCCALSTVSTYQNSVKVLSLLQEFPSKKFDIEFAKQLNEDSKEYNTFGRSNDVKI
ncbi:unnamed protein product [Moneuplotes crassus]|uniref:Uncharacterized protein n=1 Tax=Euplotes crassus TaxID=5936 RepID=A0AAD2CZN7_EUPCR|nr:unnamed protein product [Moneuplotes crassus]